MANLLTVGLSDFHAPVTNNLKTSISSGISNAATTIPVVSTTGFPSSGVFSVGTEVVFYSSKTGIQFENCIRAFDETSAEAYVQGTVVELRWVAAHHNNLSTEVIKIETVLGSTISSGRDLREDAGSGIDFDSVDKRITSFEDTESAVTPPFPASSRFGAKHHVTSTDEWYFHKGGGVWDLIVASTLSTGSDDWNLVTASPSVPVAYVTPKIVSFVNSAEGSLLITSTLSDYLTSFDGFTVLGREGETLRLKTHHNEIATIVNEDRLAAPYMFGLQIDNPVINKISTFTLIPDTTRNIRKVYAVGAGDSGFIEVNLNRVMPGGTIDTADVLVTLGVTIVNSVTPGSSSVSLGAWNETNFTISTGDILFTKVTSVSGSVGRITATVEAPFFVI